MQFWQNPSAERSRPHASLPGSLVAQPPTPPAPDSRRAFDGSSPTYMSTFEERTLADGTTAMGAKQSARHSAERPLQGSPDCPSIGRVGSRPVVVRRAVFRRNRDRICAA
jgi:hypothetical protein